MRTRKHNFMFYMNDKEKKHFDKQVELSGLTKSDVLRALVAGVEIKARLPADYYEVYRLTANLANNINQIAKHANTTEYINPNQMDAAIIMIEKCWEHIKGLR